MHYGPVKHVVVLKPTANKQHPLPAETYDPIRSGHPQVAVFASEKIARGEEITNLVGRIAQMSEQEIEDLIEAPEMFSAKITLPGFQEPWQSLERRRALSYL
jgi:hypothetical protein